MSAARKGGRPVGSTVMPGIIKGYQKPRGRGYYVCFPVGSQYQGTHTFATKREAKAFVLRSVALGIHPEGWPT